MSILLLSLRRFVLFLAGLLHAEPDIIRAIYAALLSGSDTISNPTGVTSYSGNFNKKVMLGMFMI